MIPKTEIDFFWNQVNNRPEYFSPDRMVRAYRKSGLKVIPDPFGIRVLKPVIRALKKREPFSVIRIGDGEACVLSYGAYAGTPNLDKHAIIASVGLMQDSFRVTETWMSVLRDYTMSSVLEADLIGCRSLTKSVQHFFDSADLKARTRGDLRGAVGIFRAADFMLHLARRKTLSGKIVGSAHLYFSVLNHLETLLLHAPNVICISSEAQVTERLKRKYPHNRFTHISVGKVHPDGSNRPEPSFLGEVESCLPIDLGGTLCLVGAGIWAEIYCTWIKRKGGVGIDIGSGFDLLSGRATRPAHKEVLGEVGKKYL